MGIKLSSYKTDKDLVDNGVWVDVGDGAALKVGKVNNSGFRKLAIELRKPYRHYDVAGKELPDDINKRINIELVARTLLLDWRGYTDDDGNNIPYSFDVAKETLENDEFMALVLAFSNDTRLFRGVAVEEERKNLPMSSGSKLPVDAAG